MSDARISRLNLDCADVAARPKLWPKDEVPENIRLIGGCLDRFGSFKATSGAPVANRLVRASPEGEAFPRDHLPALQPLPKGRCSRFELGTAGVRSSSNVPGAVSGGNGGMKPLSVAAVISGA